MSHINRKQYLFYAVTDRRWLKHDQSLNDAVEEAIQNGVTCVQLREKKVSDDEYIRMAVSLKKTISKYDIPLIINDKLNVALEAKVDGVHFGQKDVNQQDIKIAKNHNLTVGISVSTVEQALKAEEMGADYLGIGAMFDTKTKSDAKLISFEMLGKIRKATNLPIVVIGGITKENISKFKKTGIDGIAIISNLFAAISIAKKAKILSKLISQVINNSNRLESVLTISGSDSSGGAGIQADIKTISNHNLYSSSVITALVAQNTKKIGTIQSVSADFLSEQLELVINDIYPSAIKIGMVGNTKNLNIISAFIKKYNLKNVVLDPVLISTSGINLITDIELVEYKKIVNQSLIITPNLFEAKFLANFVEEIEDQSKMIEAAKKIRTWYNGAILIKGGQLKDCSDDLLMIDSTIYWFKSKKNDTKNTHGSGSTLSSAIASGLASGLDIIDSVRQAKKYVSFAIKNNPKLGHGFGPLNHISKTWE